MAEGYELMFRPNDAVAGDSTGSYSITVDGADVEVSYYFFKAVAGDTTWYDASRPQNSYTLSTLEQLVGFSRLVNAGNKFENTTIVLGEDMDAQAVNWAAIGTREHPFNGVFDGNGKNITLFVVRDGLTGLFGYTGQGTEVKDVTVDGLITGGNYAAGIVAYNQGAMSGVRSNVDLEVRDGSVADDQYVGGVVAYSQGEVQNSSFTGGLHANLSGKNVCVGGVMGLANTNSSGNSNGGALSWQINSVKNS